MRFLSPGSSPLMCSTRMALSLLARVATPQCSATSRYSGREAKNASSRLRPGRKRKHASSQGTRHTCRYAPPTGIFTVTPAAKQRATSSAGHVRSQARLSRRPGFLLHQPHTTVCHSCMCSPRRQALPVPPSLPPSPLSPHLPPCPPCSPPPRSPPPAPARGKPHLHFPWMPVTASRYNSLTTRTPSSRLRSPRRPASSAPPPLGPLPPRPYSPSPPRQYAM